MAASSVNIVAVAGLMPEELEYDVGSGKPIISEEDAKIDALDDFNHPRLRKAHIVAALAKKYKDVVSFEKPPGPIEDIITMYKNTHSEGLLSFLVHAWIKWEEMGDGRDPFSALKSNGAQAEPIPPLVPGNVTIPRDPHQRPTTNVMGQIGYYSTDLCTPIFKNLLDELRWDAATIEHALALVMQEGKHSVIYAIPTHPGHHGAMDSFGGYCYINQAAYSAQVLQQIFGKTAVLDVDYHCGNGTASIFYDNPDILVVSIHCHPDHDYPFHSGFEDENEVGKAIYHLPLLPGATWDTTYKAAVGKAMKRIADFGAQALVVSMGLDTLDGDPVTMRRAGFRLKGSDYVEMGRLIGSELEQEAKCMFIQEGGYKMEELGQAAADVVAGFASQRKAT